VKPVAVAEYLYGLLGSSAWLRLVGVSKTTGPIGVPITKDEALFNEVSGHGRELLWLATGGKRGSKPPASRSLPPRKIKVIKDLGSSLPTSYTYEEASANLVVGEGILGPVPPEVWRFEVSGLKVVPSWLSYRLATRAGKKSSPLDEIRPTHWEQTHELLALLHSLEGMVAMEPRSESLIRRVLESEVLAYGEHP